MNKINAAKNTDLLKSVPSFSSLDHDALARILEKSERKSVARGEFLIRQGGKADVFYIVLRGRFTVLVGETPIAEIPIGEPIGELAFFAGGLRTANVVAARDSEVLMLTCDAYDDLSIEIPDMGRSVLASVAGRLAKNTSASPKLRPQPGNIVALVPAGGQKLPDGFATQLESVFSGQSAWELVSQIPGEALENQKKLAQWMAGIESSGNGIVFDCSSAELTRTQLEHITINCDTVYLVGKMADSGSGTIELAPIERALISSTLPSNLRMVILRDQRDIPIQNSNAWLEKRPVALHHHMALDSTADFERLSRFIRGRAMGLVLSGGGAFGTAHLGAIKALQEHGHAIDMVGGTSIGAAMAAALALEFEPDQVMALCEQMFLKSKAMSRLTVPLYSVIDHLRLDDQLRQQFGSTKIEDMPLNYFAVATSLTKNNLHIARTGLLWEAVRASSSIPAVFPPMVTDDGEVLIDGSLIDNVPISVMRDLKPGPNLVLNFKQRREWRVTAKYEDLPGRLGALKNMIWRRRGQARFPSIFSILSRSMIVSSKHFFEQARMDGDVLIEISTLRAMGFLDWTKGRLLFDAAYSDMSQALDATAKQTKGSQYAHLVAVSEIINSE